MDKAVEVAEAKYPKEEGYRLYWIFNHSSCHTTCADSLNASKMNVKPSGCQPLMHDTVWNGNPQKLTIRVLIRGHHTIVEKGLIEVLTEWGCYRPKMKVDEMRTVITSHLLTLKMKSVSLINFF